MGASLILGIPHEHECAVQGIEDLGLTERAMEPHAQKESAFRLFFDCGVDPQHPGKRRIFLRPWSGPFGEADPNVHAVAALEDLRSARPIDVSGGGACLGLGGSRDLVLEDVLAQSDALIADVDVGSRNQLLDPPAALSKSCT
jgi:hypothetical protein